MLSAIGAAALCVGFIVGYCCLLAVAMGYDEAQDSASRTTCPT